MQLYPLPETEAYISSPSGLKKCQMFRPQEIKIFRAISVQENIPTKPYYSFYQSSNNKVSENFHDVFVTLDTEAFTC